MTTKREEELLNDIRRAAMFIRMWGSCPSEPELSGYLVGLKFAYNLEVNKKFFKE